MKKQQVKWQEEMGGAERESRKSRDGVLGGTRARGPLQPFLGLDKPRYTWSR